MKYNSRQSSSGPKKYTSPFGILGSIVLLCLVLVPLGAQASLVPEEFQSTVVVSPAGKATANGQALLAAVGQANSSRGNRLLIWIEPGIYDLGSKPLTLKPYLSIQGSGREATVIRGSAQTFGSFDRNKGLIQGADNSSLKDLTLSCVSNEERGEGACIHVVNSNASPTISNIKIASNGYGSHWGIRNTFASPLIENFQISLGASINNYGIVSSINSFPTVRRGEINASDGSNHNSGIFNRDGGLPMVIDDVEIFAASGSEAFAIYNFTPTAPGRMEIVDSLLTARDADDNGAIRNGAIVLEAQGSTFEAATPGSAVLLSPNGSIDIRDSELSGSEVLAFAGQVKLGSVRLTGTGSISAVDNMACAAIFSLTGTAQFYESTCPASRPANVLKSAAKAIRSHPFGEQVGQQGQ